LKLFCVYVFNRVSSSVFIVPIRDWNSTSKTKKMWDFCCFYRPYKGLKLTTGILQLNLQELSFYRPYKGLKPCKRCFVLSSTSCFYRPYKGLKLHAICYNTMKHSSFYRPYKGLKLFDCDIVAFYYKRVFIVPIRDWNDNENEYFSFSYWVFIVPIRDWNLHSDMHFWCRMSSFYRPYKGLKLITIYNKFYFFIQVFIVPIRDWNQFLSDTQKMQLFRFYRPYKGLKLSSFTSTNSFISCFYRPYKGLKQNIWSYFLLCR